jgi:transcriptional regulator with XRE-family HTH domain
MAPAKVEIEARRRVAAARRQLAVDIRRMRADVGLSQVRLAAEARIAQSYLSRIESDEAVPSLEIYGRIATALGADLACRVYPNTGPAVHDRHQVAIARALLKVLHPRWQRWPEVAVRRPARGWIDLVLNDATEREVIACEIESELRRLEQLLRWSAEKAASLPSASEWPYGLDETVGVSRLLVIRATRRNRDLAREFDEVIAAAFPGSPASDLAAVSGTGRWPGPALLWAHASDAGYRISASPAPGRS